MSDISIKRFNERERFYEIIGGEKYVPPSPNLNHNETIQNLMELFKNILGKQNYKYYGEFVDVVLDNKHTVQPDFKIVGDFSKIADGKNIKGAPDFIVEVLSPSNSSHDLITKKNLYQKHGVKEYWIVDISNKNVYVYLLENGAYDDPNIYHYFTDEEIEEIENDFNDYLKEQIKIKEIITHTFGDEIRVPLNKIFENI